MEKYLSRTIRLIGYRFVKEGTDMAGMRTLCKQGKKELKILAKDFGLLHRGDVQEIIETCRNYEET